MVIGFTGSRDGLTKNQCLILMHALVRARTKGAQWLHHGWCIGSDKAAHQLARTLGYLIHGHPPDITKRRAKNIRADVMDTPEPYKVRNQAIVDACTVLIATPRKGSRGTWDTVNRAKAARKPVLIIHEDGREEWLLPDKPAKGAEPPIGPT